MPSRTSARWVAGSGAAASRPSSSVSQRHFSSLPATPSNIENEVKKLDADGKRELAEKLMAEAAEMEAKAPAKA